MIDQINEKNNETSQSVKYSSPDYIFINDTLERRIDTNAKQLELNDLYVNPSI